MGKIAASPSPAMLNHNLYVVIHAQSHRPRTALALQILSFQCENFVRAQSGDRRMNEFTGQQDQI